MTTQPDPKLLIGPVLEEALSLFTDESPATKPYRMFVTGEGATFGNGAPITRVIETFLTDITYIVIDGYTTRDVVLTVWVEADTPNGLAVAEKDLMAQLYKANLLWWKPPHTTAPWAVFEVATSQLVIANLGDTDFDETELRRSFTISLTCGAWVRSKDEEVAGFVPEAVDAPTEVVFSTGATLTGVSAQRRVGIGSNPTLSLVSGTVKTSMVGAATAAASRTLFTGHTFDPETPYVRIDLANWSSTRYAVRVYGRKTGSFSPSEEFTFITYMPISGGGNRYYFQRPAGSTIDEYDAIAVDAYYNLNGDAGYTNYVSIDNVKATDEPTTIGTDRQKMFTLEVGGSVEAAGSIEVISTTKGLGTTLVYTCVDEGVGALPALRPYRTDGPNSPVIDAATASGYHELLGDIANPTEFEVPLRGFVDGTHDIVFNAWTDESPDTPIFWRAELILNGTYIGLIGSGAAYGVNNAASGVFSYYTIGQVTLPPARLAPDSAAKIRLTVWGSADDTITYDDGYLLNIDAGAYTIVDCGDPATLQALGGPSNALLILGPTLDWPAPSIMVGVGLGGGSTELVPDSFYAPSGDKVQAWGRHNLPPGPLSALVVAGTAEHFTAQARYHRRSHTNTEQ